MNFFLMLTTDDYVSLLTPLLLNPNYYNFSVKEATAVLTSSSVITTVPSLLLTLVCGYIFDILGRKYVLIVANLLMGVTYILYPIVSPSVPLFCVLSTFTDLACSPLAVSPLLQDYVEKESMGRAVSFQMMGISLGVILSLTVLF